MFRFTVESVTTVLGTPLSLEIEPGECCCLSGTSGSGKSLFLRALADLDPHQGKVWLGEQTCANMPPNQWRRRVGFLPATSSWWSHLVKDHFENIDNLPTMLEHLGLSAEILKQPVSQLSSGEQQRMAIIRTLALQPDALLLDEPTANLDNQSKERVETLISHYRTTHHIPVLWVTHDPEQIQRIADQHWHLEKQGFKHIKHIKHKNTKTP